MSELDPLLLLQSKLDGYKRDLGKSIEMYNSKQILIETHLMHKENLGSLIRKFTEAIKLLT